MSKGQDKSISPHDWWLLYEEREPRFVSEDHPNAKDYVAFGLENLTVDALRARGLNKVVKLRHNIVDIKEPLSFSNLTPAVLGEVLGEKRKVPVVESMTQQEQKTMTMKEWLEYFNTPPPDRTAILNVISLEYSSTKLAKHVMRPRFVREIDWIEHLWPASLRADGDYPAVERYLLMGAAGSYVNFHIDFGGSSVWYNVVKGEKIFLLVPPTEENLKKFHEWYLTPSSKAAYFADTVPFALRVIVPEGHSIVIPGGWAHAVYTPVDTIAFGGNFLHGYSFEMQLKIHALEENLQDPQKYRFPFFEEMMWYAAEHYAGLIQGRRANEICEHEKRGLNELSKWLKFYKDKKPQSDIPALYIIDTLKSYIDGTAPPSIEAYDEEEEVEDAEGSDCLCEGKSNSQLWIGCTTCAKWYHAACVGLSEKELKELNDSDRDWYCPRCDPKSASKLPDIAKIIAKEGTRGGRGRRSKKRRGAHRSDSDEPEVKKPRVNDQ